MARTSGSTRSERKHGIDNRSGLGVVSTFNLGGILLPSLPSSSINQVRELVDRGVIPWVTCCTTNVRAGQLGVGAPVLTSALDVDVIKKNIRH